MERIQQAERERKREAKSENQCQEILELFRGSNELVVRICKARNKGYPHCTTVQYSRDRIMGGQHIATVFQRNRIYNRQ